MAIAKADRKLVLITSALVIGAGLFFASVLIFATGTSSPSSENDGPLYVGPKSDIILKLDEGSPLYFANPFGGRGFWMDREAGALVALDVGRYEDPDCSIRWRGSKGSYIDCDGTRLDKTEMARHPVEVKTSGKQKGGVFVDLDTLDPPAATTASTLGG
ncbi:MAG: hypothetical protein FJW95_09655 [Actinobacteria bacterium]|nr:hypothetical protein [Actinomycetota bacterium]